MRPVVLGIILAFVFICPASTLSGCWALLVNLLVFLASCLISKTQSLIEAAMQQESSRDNVEECLSSGTLHVTSHQHCWQG